MPRDKQPIRGRPKTQLIDRLRVVVWSHHVMAVSGHTTAQDFESRYTKSNRKVVLSSGLWARYLRGEVIPQGAKTKRSRSLVDRLNSEYQGTSSIYQHPVWELLDLSQLLDPEQLKQAYLKLPADISKVFVLSEATRGADEPEREYLFWRIHQSENNRNAHLKKLHGLDGLAVSLIEARMDYLAQNESALLHSLGAAIAICKSITDSPPFAPKRMVSAGLLIECICAYYLHRLLVRNSPRDEAADSRRLKAWRMVDEWSRRWSQHRTELSFSSQDIFDKWTLEAWGDPNTAPEYLRP